MIDHFTGCTMRFHLLIGLLAVVASRISGTSSFTNQSQIEFQSSECPKQRSFSSRAFEIYIPFQNTLNSIDCKFNIEAYVQDVCRLQVTFSQFQLPSTKSCQEQFLKIGDKRVCGSIVGAQKFPFSGNITEIVYRGDGKYPVELQIQQERCKVRAIAKTCDVTSTEKLTKISSPNYPFPYPTPLTCLYTIQNLPQETCQATIRFVDFNIPESTDCLRGRLLIDGEPYCGKKTGLVIFRNITNEFTLEFSEGSGQTNGAFQLSIEKEKCQSISTNISADQESYFSNGIFPGGLPLCCNRPFSTPYFVLTSPGFFVTTPSDINCIYQIIQASPQYCRLRFNFVHFWIGQEDLNYGCFNEFLEIDGRRICGCQDGLTIFSGFNGGVKELRFKMRNSLNKGFLIEATQEECYAKSGKSLPEDVTENPNNEVEIFSNKTQNVSKRFILPAGNSQCFQRDPKLWLDTIKVLFQSAKTDCPIPSLPTPISPIIPAPTPIPPLWSPNYPVNPIIPPPSPIPPYLPPNYPINPIIPPPMRPFPPFNPINPIIPPANPNPPILPPPTYPINPIIPPPAYPKPPHYPVNPIIPPSNPNPPILPPTYPTNPIIPPPAYPQPPHYPVNPIIPPGHYPPISVPPIIPPPFPYPPNVQHCQVLTGAQGGFSSPRYPSGYPSSLKCCYRVKQLYGYCRVQLIILDFDVAWSPKCIKDYLLLDGRARYCGRSLQSTTSYLNFRNNYASIDFVTSILSSLGSRSRGFRAVYRQLPCNLPRSSDDSCQPDVPFFYPSTPKPPQWGSDFDLNVPAE